MIVSLVNIGPGHSASTRLLASQLESNLPDLYVQLVDIVLPPAGRQAGGAPHARPEVRPWAAQLDRALWLVSQAEPQLVAICCSLLAGDAGLDLARRFQVVLPKAQIVLGGPGAVTCIDGSVRMAKATGIADARISQGPKVGFLTGGVLSALTGFIADLSPGSRDKACDLIPLGGPLSETGHLHPGKPRRGAQQSSSGHLLLTRLDDLIQAHELLGEAVVVEPVFGGAMPLSLHLHLHPAAGGLSADDAAGQIRVLLGAGLTVLLADPPLVSDRAHLARLLLSLEHVPCDRLLLEVPDAILDEKLVQLVLGAGIRHLRLDLSGLVRGTVQAQATGALLGPMLDRNLDLEGVVTFGLPGLDLEGFARGLDRCIQVGLEQLDLQRLCAPPGTVLGRQAPRLGLVCAPTPPYEVLAHDDAGFEEILGMVRLAEAYRYLRSAVAGTGLLKGLLRVHGSIAEVLEGFYAGLFTRGHDLLAGDPPGPAERLFSEYLRHELGLRIQPQGGGISMVRSSSLALRWPREGVRIVTDEATGRVAQVGRGALRLLDRMGQPQTVNEAFERLVTEVPPQRRERLRRDLHSTVDKLVSMGFLVPARPDLPREATEHERPFISLEEFDYHYRMLSDTMRVGAYRRAIGQGVRPGQHVVEIGTGTGILAVLCARAGARVTAIERFSILNIARYVAERSDAADRISFMRGRADLVHLEELGDVLVSEIVGNRILNEGLLEATLDARRRLLRPGARLIPQQIEIQAELGYTTRFAHVAREFIRLGKRYGVDLCPLGQWFADRQQAGEVVWELNREEQTFEPLSRGVTVVSLDLRTLQEPDFFRKALLVPLRPGVVNAVALSFRLELLPGIELSTRGEQHGLHWSKPVYMLPAPLRCRPAIPVPLSLSYRAHGEIRVAVGDAALAGA